ncbi:nucleotide sugar dehydrogenase [Algiphilus aromaticivorans]|uniref:nucleotide sugar dehydrogenase n=1 Tax=Algiphilus aromaticivorans TaxID=382454 RepID=UPI0005C20302|nr:nucleotide sugar dehydrogenase [Algiphilus aromaticivorans]
MESGTEETVAIIGLGYVGLPLLLRCSEAGFRVIGIDADPDKTEALRAGRSYLAHIDSRRVAGLAKAGAEFSTDCASVADADVVVLCLPTPLDEHLQPDLSFVTDTLDAIAPHVRAGQLLSLESTTYPGTTEEEVCARVAARGFTVGEDVFVVYSPEREDPGNAAFTTRTVPKVVGGATPACLERGVAFYSRVVDQVVPVSSLRAAEMTKLLENIHRAVNIGLVNEMKMVADAMDIDIHEVIDAASTKPFGFVPYRPGPGLGGHCIPIDPFYLSWKAREFGVDTRFIELAGQVNHAMPGWVVSKVSEALNAHGKPVKGSRILILGIAYKKNVDDMRETPAAEVMKLLAERGAVLSYSDPHVPRFKPMRRYRFDLESVPLSAETLAAQDCVVLVTDHDAFDYELIGRASELIVDTRGRFRGGAPGVVAA